MAVWFFSISQQFWKKYSYWLYFFQSFSKPKNVFPNKISNLRKTANSRWIPYLRYACKLQICPSIHSLFPSLTHMHAGTQAHMHTHTHMHSRTHTHTHTHTHRLLISLNVAHLFQTVQECCHAHVKPEMTTVLMLSKHYHRVLMCKVFKISSSRTWKNPVFASTRKKRRKKKWLCTFWWSIPWLWILINVHTVLIVNWLTAIKTDQFRDCEY